MNTEQNPKTWKQDFIELVKFVAIVLVIIIPIRIFIAQPFIVNGDSMVPTLTNGDYLIVDEISYTLGNTIQRGDVVVFRFPDDNNRFLIKRIIGLPEENVTISGDTITITKADSTEIVQLNETYLNGPFSSYGTWELGPEDYFVMGDNRRESSDSRSWGLLKKDLIIGKTFLRLFPISQVQYQPGEYQPEEIETLLPAIVKSE
jgi:signal peptidase I